LLREVRPIGHTVTVVRAALIGNHDDMDPGLVGHELRLRGVSFVELHREDHGSWADPGTARVTGGLDLVVSLGSSWSTYWPEVEEAVSAEQRFLAAAHRAGVPVLGICFGAQQLSIALGGRVESSQTHEIGWHEVTPVQEAAVSTGAAGSPLGGRWFQWHYDRFSVPAGATALADSSVSPQAFVSGRALGLQFHPEVTETIATNWSRGDGERELAAAGIDRDSLLTETRRMQDDVRPRTAALVEWFLTRVAQTHT
jgi:GMP synthase-like glutamine amidotransferase